MKLYARNPPWNITNTDFEQLLGNCQRAFPTLRSTSMAYESANRQKCLYEGGKSCNATVE